MADETSATPAPTNGLAGVKSLLQSTTIRGLLISTVGGLAGNFTHGAVGSSEVAEGYALVLQGLDLVANVMAFGGLVMAFWGRVKAKDKLV